MAKVIPFKKREKLDSQSIQMMKIADEFDAVIIKQLESDIDIRDLAGLIAHRLGTLMRHVDDETRETLWVVCSKVLREQADLDKAT